MADEAKEKRLVEELERLRALCRAERWGEVVDGARSVLRESPLCGPALLLFAQAAQLLPDEQLDAATERDIETRLALAVTSDPNSVEALNELACFRRAYYAAEGAGLPLFDKAIALAKRQLRESLIGKIRSLVDDGDSAGAELAREEARRLFGDEQDFDAE